MAYCNCIEWIPIMQYFRGSVKIIFLTLMRKITVLFISVLLLLLPGKAYGIYDPLSVPNNKFGIHIIDENDLEKAASLVNSSAGDWGYVTMVLPMNERKTEKWNAIFEKIKNLHLIPIIRIATRISGDYWEKPALEDADNTADFLNSLNWFTKNRYIILFNEPNHAKEWGMTLDPKGYADIQKTYFEALKKRSDDFFIMMAGFDSSAPNSPITMDQVKYIREMMEELPDLGEYLDGWVSHSYPNPGFTGRKEASGRGTIRNFQWERTLLTKLGINKHIPVFITETGWPHNEGDPYNKFLHDPDTVSENMVFAAENIWNDGEIAAVTPFVLNYKGYPFSNFSWVKSDGSGNYPQFEAYQSIPKIAGQPKLKEFPSPTPTEEVIQGISTQAVYQTEKKGLLLLLKEYSLGSARRIINLFHQ